MRIPTRIIAAIQLVLVIPAALFMTAVLVNAGDSPKYDLARLAQRIVIWYSGRMWTLWLLLLALPCVVLIAGCATLLGTWKRDVEVLYSSGRSLTTIQAPLATLGIVGTTLASAAILAIVMLHMLAN
jgi:hypothetical protein